VTQTAGGDPIPGGAVPASTLPTTGPPPTSGRSPWYRRVPWLPEAAVALLSLVVFAYRVARPSPWWDEAITRDVTSRPASEIVDLATRIDLVHATYYLLVHALLGESASVTPIRLISVVAAATTSLLLVRLGRELGSLQVGVTAALVWTVAPLVTRYAQEARPYALVAMAATLSTVLLVRVCRKPWLPRRWVLYGVSIGLIGVLNVIGLLMIVVHLGYVLASSSRTARRRWYLATAGGLALTAPVLLGSATQREQVSWLPRPGLDALTGFLLAQYATGTVVVVLLLLACFGLGRGTNGPALGLGLVWAFLPPVLLWTISQAHPLFDWRYVFFTVPGGALAIASLAPLLKPRVMTAVVVVLALFGLHMQEVYRWRASGHGENLRGVAEAIKEGGRPGDAVIFLPGTRRVVKLAYPGAFTGVDDIGLARTGEQSTTLIGIEEPTDVIAKELKHRNRVWVVTGAQRFGEGPEADERTKEELIDDRFRLTDVPLGGRYEVRLYTRTRASR
jgi:mannosyltransferase